MGDLGIGLPQTYYPEVLPPNFRFIRGNKDNPFVCQNHPNYLGDYGYIKMCNLFYVSGAWSINWRYKKMGHETWDEEQLSYEQLAEMVHEYVLHSPSVVVSHECPDLAFNELWNKDLMPTRTSSALGLAYEQWQPDYWIFGHWHSNKSKKVGKTHFICLDELHYIDIPDLQWDLPFHAIYPPIRKVEDLDNEWLDIPEISADQMVLPGLN